MSKDIRSALKEALLSSKSKIRKMRGKSYGKSSKENSAGETDPASAAGLGSSAGGSVEKGPNKSSSEVRGAEGEVRNEMAVVSAGLGDQMKDFMSNRNVKRPTKKTAKGKPLAAILKDSGGQPNKGKKGKA